MGILVYGHPRERERERPCIDPRADEAGRLALRPVITFQSRSLSRPSKEHCALTIVSQLNQPLRFLVCRPRDNSLPSAALFLPPRDNAFLHNWRLESSRRFEIRSVFQLRISAFGKRSASIGQREGEKKFLE